LRFPSPTPPYKQKKKTNQKKNPPPLLLVGGFFLVGVGFFQTKQPTKKKTQKKPKKKNPRPAPFSFQFFLSDFIGWGPRRVVHNPTPPVRDSFFHRAKFSLCHFPLRPPRNPFSPPPQEAQGFLVFCLSMRRLYLSPLSLDHLVILSIPPGGEGCPSCPCFRALNREAIGPQWRFSPGRSSRLSSQDYDSV